MDDYRISDFRLKSEKNILATPYSEDHGEGFLLHDDPGQLGAGLLIENIGDATGMIAIVKGNEMAFVIKNMDDKTFGYIDLKKRPLSDAGKIFKELDLDCYGILIDCGSNGKGKRKYKILSDKRVRI